MDVAVAAVLAVIANAAIAALEGCVDRRADDRSIKHVLNFGAITANREFVPGGSR